MKIAKLILLALVLTIMSLSVQLAAQNTENSSEEVTTGADDSYESASDQTSSIEMDALKSSDTSKDDKKKKKDKDVIKLGEHFFINLGIDMLTMLIIILFIYYPVSRKKENVFSLMMFNIVIYLLTFVLNDVKISMGAAFGLFAVFSMLRYRTAGISMKDMTYLFVFIALGLVSAISMEYYELAIICGIVLIMVFILDGGVLFRREYMKNIIYEKIENIREDKYEELMADLIARTGLDIHRISIGRINYLRDSANIKVFYYHKKKKIEAPES